MLQLLVKRESGIALKYSSSSVDSDEVIAADVSSYSVHRFSEFCKVLNYFMKRLMRNV